MRLLFIGLISGAVFVNGWTDAPNAITGVVATKAMSYRSAVWFAAICNLSGLLIISTLNSSVAGTITGMADFSAQAPSLALAALLAAMASIILFASAAWLFGIPTSESHALIAALTGASFALGAGINPAAWQKILTGLAMSLVLGFLLGRVSSKALGGFLRKLSAKTLDGFQIFAAGVMAFMHGAQDGQKFAAVFVIAELLAKDRYYSGPIELEEHALVLVLCALVMALGTSVGGGRIIDTVGSRMVSLEKHLSVCADLGSGLCLLIASLTGVPMSTTHTKTTAIMGCVPRKKRNPAVIGEMFLAWIITFPVCGALGFLLAKLFISALGSNIEAFNLQTLLLILRSK